MENDMKNIEPISKPTVENIIKEPDAQTQS